VSDDRTEPENAPSRDPRLEIPQALRDPVRHPSLEPKKPSVMSGSIGEAGTALAIGVDFLVMIVAGAGVGWLADRQFGWAPVGLLVGLTLGMTVGLVRLIHRLSKDDRAARGGAKK
jgi:ATP synthase protein I